MTIGKWIKKWTVDGSVDKPWTVSLSDQGIYGCSCPRWKFKREECHHIGQVKAGFGTEIGSTTPHRPEYVLAHVCAPTLKDGNLLIPLIPFGDTPHMEATICYVMLENGYSWSEVKEHRHLPRQWTAGAVLAYIKQHSLAWRKCCDKHPHKSCHHEEEEGKGNQI